jgi:hypothetical protein
VADRSPLTDPTNPLLLLIFVPGLVWSVYTLHAYRHFAATALEATGTAGGRDGSNFYIHYQVDGRSYVIEEPAGKRGGRYGAPAGPVTVLYDPADPAHARWENARNWVAPALIGAMCALGCLGVLFRRSPRPLAGG